MKRYAAQLVFFSPDNVIRNGLVELDENRVVKRLTYLDGHTEIANTVFYNGILFPSMQSELIPPLPRTDFLAYIKSILKGETLDLNASIHLYLLSNLDFIQEQTSEDTQLQLLV